MKIFFEYILRLLSIILLLGIIYLLTLFFPQPFFKHKLTVENITVYSDEEIPQSEMKSILATVLLKLKKSEIYREDLRQNIYIANNDLRWRYFTNVNHKVGGLAYVAFNHNVFLRKVDIKANRLYGASGNKIMGNRTLDYFITHEITHSLEFLSMPFYKYPIVSNWTLEGYSEYIGHGSETYEQALNQYLKVPEISGAKYYTRVRVMVAYLLEKEKLPISELWSKVNEEEAIRLRAIPNDKPLIDDTLPPF